MLKMNKQVVLLGTSSGKSPEEFYTYYLENHAGKVAEHPKVKQYYANKILEPDNALIEAGWGWGGNEVTDVLAMDELWVEDGFDVMSLYKDPEIDVKLAYDTDEVIIRPTLAKWDLGTKSPWIKRIGLLRIQDGQRPEDFFAYWQKAHAPLALRTHIGQGFYAQMHFKKPLAAAKSEWNGMMILDYWSLDSFKFGHFSRPTASQEIKEDCAIFLNVFNALLGEEYVMKRMDGYIDAMFEDFPIRPNE